LWLKKNMYYGDSVSSNVLTKTLRPRSSIVFGFIESHNFIVSVLRVKFASTPTKKPNSSKSLVSF